MKVIAWALMLIVMLLPVHVLAGEGTAAQADARAKAELENEIDSVMEGIDLDGLEQWYEQAGRPLGSVTFEEAVRSIAENGLTDITFEQALNAAGTQLKSALAGSASVIARIIMIVLMMALLKNMQSSFNSTGMSDAAQWVCYILVAVLTASVVSGSTAAAGSALDTLGGIVDVITPTLIGLLTALGGLTSSSLMSPLLAALTGGVFGVVRELLFPAVLVFAVILLISGMSSSIKLKKLAALIGSLIKWALGIMFVVFLGICALKGFVGSGIDGISLKTAKYTIDKMVPVIGGMFSDTLDTILAGGLIVKNAVGAGGLIIMVCVMAAPVAGLAADSLLLRIGSAVAEPFADQRTSELLSGMSAAVRLMFIAVLVCVSMAFISISLLVGTASLAAMLR